MLTAQLLLLFLALVVGHRLGTPVTPLVYVHTHCGGGLLRSQEVPRGRLVSAEGLDQAQNGHALNMRSDRASPASARL
jgi:hypothetical protein